MLPYKILSQPMCIILSYLRCNSIHKICVPLTLTTHFNGKATSTLRSSVRHYHYVYFAKKINNSFSIGGKLLIIWNFLTVWGWQVSLLFVSQAPYVISTCLNCAICFNAVDIYSIPVNYHYLEGTLPILSNKLILN